MRNLSPAEVKATLDAGAALLLDVREPAELAIARITGARNIPLSELSARMSELDPASPVIALCHHGVRSELAGRILERGGFAQVSHLSGGIDAWSQEVDPAIPRY